MISSRFGRERHHEKVCRSECMLKYLAAPYSHNDPDVQEQRIASFCLFDAKLASTGVYTVSPLFKTVLFKYTDKVPTDWEFWRSYAEQLMFACDELVVITLPGWDKSVGVLGEIEMAKQFGIKISYVEPIA